MAEHQFDEALPAGGTNEPLPKPEPKPGAKERLEAQRAELKKLSNFEKVTELADRKNRLLDEIAGKIDALPTDVKRTVVFDMSKFRREFNQIFYGTDDYEFRSAVVDSLEISLETAEELRSTMTMPKNKEELEELFVSLQEKIADKSDSIFNRLEHKGIHADWIFRLNVFLGNPGGLVVMMGAFMVLGMLAPEAVLIVGGVFVGVSLAGFSLTATSRPIPFRDSVQGKLEGQQITIFRGSKQHFAYELLKPFMPNITEAQVLRLLAVENEEKKKGMTWNGFFTVIMEKMKEAFGDKQITDQEFRNIVEGMAEFIKLKPPFPARPFAKNEKQA